MTTMLYPKPLEVNELADIEPQIIIEHSHSLHSPRLDTPMLLDSETSSTFTREFAPRHHLHKNTIYSDDEPRLFQDLRQQNDPEAIPIIPPGSKRLRDRMGPKGIPPGFLPRNTLGRNSNDQGMIASVDHIGSGIPKRTNEAFLECEAVIGDNVKVIIPSDTTQAAERPLKRPKLTPRRSSLSSTHVFDLTSGSSLDFDPDPRTEDYIVTRSEQSPGRSQRRKSHGPSNYSQASSTFQNMGLRKRISEFSNLENAMDSKQKHVGKRRNRRSSNNLQNDSSSTMTGLLDSSDPIQHSSDHELEYQVPKIMTRSVYKGTARILPLQGINHSKADAYHSEERRETGERSSHFTNPPKSKTPHDIRGGRDSNHTKGQDRVRHPNGNLRNQYISVDGKRLSQDISSDELCAGGTAAVVSAGTSRSPSKERRSNSPTKIPSFLKPMSNLGYTRGLAPSNIAPSVFTASQSKRLSKTPSHRITYSGEKLASWSIGLDAVNKAGDLIQHDGLGLDFNEDAQRFVVRAFGEDLSAGDPSLQVQVRKLLTVIWSQSSSKIRFVSSKCGNQDHVLDVQLRTVKGAYDLVMYLSGLKHKAKLKQFPSEHMDKIFEKRLLEQKLFSKPLTKDASYQPLDVQLAVKNQERRNTAEKSDELSEEHNVRRRYTVNESIGLEASKGRETERPFLLPRQRKSSQIFDKYYNDEPPSIKSNPSKAGTSERMNADTILQKIHDQPPNPHMGRPQTRSNAKLQSLEHQSSLGEANPSHFRPSIKQDIGPQWRKPLVYPKMGKKKTTVEWIDLERLEEGEYLNDNLIGFYLRFLEHELEAKSPELAKKVYFFNSFFFTNLTSSQGGKKGINYEAVQKWTRSIDVFSYDYIVVPINESIHWYVAIICNLPGLVRTLDEEETLKDEPPRLPEDEMLHDEPEFALVQVAGRNSSPVAPAPVEDLVLLKEIVHPKDAYPSESFASLSLEPDLERFSKLDKIQGSQKTANDLTFDGADQGMLDAQIEENMADSRTSEPREVPPGAADKEKMGNESGVIEDGKRYSTASKKRKRKSIPPIQRLNPSGPLIITFDSLGLSHLSTIRILKDYLQAEGKAKRSMEWDATRIRGLTAKQIPVQTNYWDCGLFLLGYIAKFLTDPKDFITKIIGKEYDIERDWSNLKPSDLRDSMRKQILDLHALQQDDRRESAKKADKYRSKQQQSLEGSPSKDVTRHEITPAKPEDSLGQQLITAAQNTLDDSPSTRKMALKNAIPIEYAEAKISMEAYYKKPIRIFDPGPDPQPNEPAIDVRQSPGPQLRDNPSVAFIDSQSNAAAENHSQFPRSSSTPPANPQREFNELPSEIQDSQPGSFQENYVSEDDTVYPRTPPRHTLAMPTGPKEPSSSVRSGVPTPCGRDLDDRVAWNRPRRTPKRMASPEIVEID